jgi:hypothetical protein
MVVLGLTVVSLVLGVVVPSPAALGGSVVGAYLTMLLWRSARRRR